MSYAQAIVGPPGSGKTTYTAGAKEFLTALGRKVATVNLDPANENVPYDVDVNVSDLIALDDAMTELKLGPNGALIYCIEYLADNLEWLQEELKKHKGKYLLFDLPGQVELFTNHQGMKDILTSIQKWGYNLCVVHLVDSQYCSDPATFISVLMVSLSTMCHLELPHVNVLSKIDNLESYHGRAFAIDYYTEVLDLEYLLDRLNDDPRYKKYRKLNEAIVEVVENYGMVSFKTLAVESKDSMQALQDVIDTTNGYMFGHLDAREAIKTSQRPQETEQVPEVYREYDALQKQHQEQQQSELKNTTTEAAQADKSCLACMRVSDSLKRCSRCKKVYFCNLTCQKRVWKQHKPLCNAR